VKTLTDRIRQVNRRRLALDLAVLTTFVLLMEGVQRLLALYADSHYDTVSDAARSAFTLGFLFALVAVRLLSRPVNALYRRFAPNNRPTNA
jgi:hypothetical protein